MPRELPKLQNITIVFYVQNRAVVDTKDVYFSNRLEQVVRKKKLSSKLSDFEKLNQLFIVKDIPDDVAYLIYEIPNEISTNKEKVNITFSKSKIVITYIKDDENINLNYNELKENILSDIDEILLIFSENILINRIGAFSDSLLLANNQSEFFSYVIEYGSRYLSTKTNPSELTDLNIFFGKKVASRPELKNYKTIATIKSNKDQKGILYRDDFNHEDANSSITREQIIDELGFILDQLAPLQIELEMN